MDNMGKKSSIRGGVVATILHFLLKLFVFMVGSKHSSCSMQTTKIQTSTIASTNHNVQ